MSNTAATRDDVKEALADWSVPGLGLPLSRVATVASVEEAGDGLKVELLLGVPLRRSLKVVETALADHLAEKLGVKQVDLDIRSDVASRAVQRNLEPLPGIRNIIAVASGKGGVGKSTTAVNLALALAQEGARVGVLDADIYGPSQPRMLGISGRPTSRDGKIMEPKENHGVKAMSIGFLVDEEQPMVWRGPMVSQALSQLLNETDWGELDYLIVDMPPGTGDAQLTLSQRVPLSGAVIVTTPQDIALLDARKGLQMFRKVDVDVLGIIENMGTHICSNCGHEEAIFGAEGGAKMAAQYDAPFLGSLPLDIRIREQADGGEPTVVADPDGELAASYRRIALNMVAELASSGGDGDAFPTIRIED
ncbi:MAG: iron-sulfur cluster carrier protein ApbC [Gammaproteobacteria bacterium]|nr:iron-sulfur cluster carrier protein ApbC [Gammaproteobacteria bacterium]